jgi:hypothetical protein
VARGHPEYAGPTVSRDGRTRKGGCHNEEAMATREGRHELAMKIFHLCGTLHCFIAANKKLRNRASRACRRKHFTTRSKAA